jgi:hypothetical protein
MKEEVFETVLNEVLDELKISNRKIEELEKGIESLTKKIETFDRRLNEQIVAPPADTQPIQQIITEGQHKMEEILTERNKDIKKIVAEEFQKVSAIVEAQPKAIVRQWRLLFFPENDYPGYYKFFVTRVLLWVTILAGIAVLCRLGMHWLDNIHSERQLELQLQGQPSSSQGSYPQPLPPHPAASPSKKIHKHAGLPRQELFRSTTPDRPATADSTGAP